jgi:imidazolonepropionase-like amidohydrolase
VHAANLAFGVTTIHDPSNDTNAIFAASELAQAGRILSPRTYSTGTILYGAMGDFKAEIDSLEDARAHLRRLKAVGAFSVKSYNQPRRDQRQQVIAAARELGMMVVPEGGSLLQHNLTMVVDGHTGVEHSLPVERIYRDVAQLWGASKTGYTPTLVVGYGGIWGENYFYQHTEVWRNERLMRFVPRFVVDPRSRRRTMAPDEDQNILRSAGIVKSIIDAGGKAQLGAHGQLAGLGAHWELWLLQRSGITNHQALRCATLYGAEYVGLDKDLGSIETGKLADMLVLDSNPLEKIENSESIRYTVLNGRVYDAHTLAPADGRGGKAPAFYFESMQEGFPAQSIGGGCAGCAH